ncbi:hypothetical protein DSECCO2_511190 [anaerobic digester metagenome]
MPLQGIVGHGLGAGHDGAEDARDLPHQRPVQAVAVGQARQGVGDGEFSEPDLLQAQGRHDRQVGQGQGRLAGVHAAGLEDRQQPVAADEGQLESVVLQHCPAVGVLGVRFQFLGAYCREHEAVGGKGQELLEGAFEQRLVFDDVLPAQGRGGTGRVHD